MNEAFLIDECLSPDLVAHAHARGHHATHVVFRGLQGTLDLDLMPTIIEEGFTFVTNNGRDFLKLYAGEEVHPGLIIIVPGNLSAARQVELFEHALAFLESAHDLVNQVLEVFLDGTFQLREWPGGRSRQEPAP